MNLYEAIKNNLVESDSSFDVEGLADRIDILMSDMNPYEHMDIYGSYKPTEESYQDTLDSLYDDPQSVLDNISSYDIVDWEDDIQTEFNDIVRDLKEWIGLSKKNEAEEPSAKGYWVKIKMKNNKQVLHLFNTEDEMYEYLNLLSHYVGQGDVEILDYTGRDDRRKNESEVKPMDEDLDDINHWHNDNYEEMWDDQAKRSWMTSDDIEWLSNQNHNTRLTEISMNYRPTGDVERDEIELNNLASDYFYDEVGIYNNNIDSLCTRWAHDQAQKINEAEGTILSPEELVKSAYEHITSELGEEATVEAVLDDIMNNYDQDYFKGETPEDSKNDFDSVRTYLRRLGLHYKDLDESEDSPYHTKYVCRTASHKKVESFDDYDDAVSYAKRHIVVHDICRELYQGDTLIDVGEEVWERDKYLKYESEGETYFVYITTEVGPGEFNSSSYGEYSSRDQADDVVAELRAQGINASVVVGKGGN
jgi:hypothetical protein